MAVTGSQSTACCKAKIPPWFAAQLQTQRVLWWGPAGIFDGDGGITVPRNEKAGRSRLELNITQDKCPALYKAVQAMYMYPAPSNTTLRDSSGWQQTSSLLFAGLHAAI